MMLGETLLLSVLLLLLGPDAGLWSSILLYFCGDLLLKENRYDIKVYTSVCPGYFKAQDGPASTAVGNVWS